MKDEENVRGVVDSHSPHAPKALAETNTEDIASGDKNPDALTSNETVGLLFSELESLCRGTGHYINGMMANIRALAEITKLKNPDLAESVIANLDSLLKFTHRGEYSAELIRLYGLGFSQLKSPFNITKELPRLINDARMSLEIDFPVTTKVTSEVSILINHELFDGCFRALMRNALQAIQTKKTDTPELSVLIGVTDTVPKMLCLSIIDNGIGMDEQTQLKATHPFFTTRKASQAVGLGLTAVHNMVERYAGELNFSSQPNIGTTVILKLPSLES